jgi:hypothetical protein
MNNKELEIVVEEWENVAKGTKTVPLIQLGSGNTDIKQERKVFEYCSKVIKTILNKSNDTSNN